MSFFDYKDDEGNPQHPLVKSGEFNRFIGAPGDILIRWQEWERTVPNYDPATGEQLDDKKLTGTTPVTLQDFINALGTRINLIEARLNALDGLNNTDDKETDDDE